MLLKSEDEEVREDYILPMEIQPWIPLDGATTWARYHGVRRLTFRTKAAKAFFDLQAEQLHGIGVEIASLLHRCMHLMFSCCAYPVSQHACGYQRKW